MEPRSSTTTFQAALIASSIVYATDPTKRPEDVVKFARELIHAFPNKSATLEITLSEQVALVAAAHLSVGKKNAAHVVRYATQLMLCTPS